MKFLYLDAAGDTEYPALGGTSRSRHYILIGFSIDPSRDWNTGSENLIRIVKKYFPNKEDSPKELHYTDLISKRKPFDALTKIQRKELADEVFSLIDKLQPVLFAIVIDKLKHKQKYVSPEKPNILALRLIVPRFSNYLKRISDCGAMVYDSEERNINKELRKFLFESREKGVVIQPADSFFYSQNRLDNLIETIFFIESHMSPIMQLADFCAHVVFLKYEREQTTRFDQIKGLLDSYKGKMYGLLEWPRNE